MENENGKQKENKKIDPYLEANTRITNHILMKVNQIKELMTDNTMFPYAMLTAKCLSRIILNLHKIGLKMKNMNKFIEIKSIRDTPSFTLNI